MSSAEIPLFTTMPPAEFDVPETDLHIRLFTEADVDNLLQLANENAVQQYVPWAKRVHDRNSAAATLSRFEEAWGNRKMARYAIEKNGEFVGYCGLWSDPTPDFYEFGFAMLPQFRGQGIGTETITELMAIAHQHMSATGMVAYVHDTNNASQAVVTRLGFSPTNLFDAGDRRYEFYF